MFAAAANNGATAAAAAAAVAVNDDSAATSTDIVFDILSKEIGQWQNESGRIHVSCPADDEGGHTWDNCATGKWHAFLVGRVDTASGDDCVAELLCVHQDLVDEFVPEYLRTWADSCSSGISSEQAEIEDDEAADAAERHSYSSSSSSSSRKKKRQNTAWSADVSVWSDHSMLGVFDYSVFPHKLPTHEPGAAIMGSAEDEDSFLGAIWQAAGMENVVCGGRGVVVSPASGLYETSALVGAPLCGGKVKAVRVAFPNTLSSSSGGDDEKEEEENDEY